MSAHYPAPRPALPVTIRPATEADRDLIRELREEFEEELDGEADLAKRGTKLRDDLSQTVREGVALIAEDDGRAVGFVFCVLGERGRKTAHVTDMYVRLAGA